VLRGKTRAGGSHLVKFYSGVPHFSRHLREAGLSDPARTRKPELNDHRISRKFLISFLPSPVNTLSGWNCTPSTGNFL
jgi:hypothetical protein